jgi:hypothetical protein
MATLRAIQAAERRREREAQKRLRELERQTKEQAKLSAIRSLIFLILAHPSILQFIPPSWSSAC